MNKPYPHGVGCDHCRMQGVCNECGGSLDPPRATGVGKTHCTNGRCALCHQTVCGIGDAHAPYRDNSRVRTIEQIRADQAACVS